MKDAKNAKAHEELWVLVHFEEGTEKEHHYTRQHLCKGKLTHRDGRWIRLEQLSAGDTVFHATRGAGHVVAIIRCGVRCRGCGVRYQSPTPFTHLPTTPFTPPLHNA